MSVSSLFGRIAPGLVALVLLTVSTSALTGQASGPPAAPVNLVSHVTSSTVRLSWQAGGGNPTLAYQIEVGSAPGANNLLVTRTPSRETVATAVPNGRYFVRVYALNAAGMSGPSNEIAVLVGCSATAPAPIGLSSQVSGDSVTLSWQPVPGALGYQVEAGSTAGLADLGVIPVNAPPIAGVVPPGEYHTRVRAVNACGAGAPSNEVVVTVGLSTPIWGKVDPLVLGTCSAALHDRYTVDGGDGYRYRTWHAQRDPSGCVFAHEHGDDPNTQTNAAIRAHRVRFGYVGRRHPMPNEPLGHEEPHEGFKIFVANRSQRNDEGRVHLHDVRLVFHMGTGGPKRFATQHHSMEYAIVTNDGRWMFVQTMGDTGGVNSICVEPRAGKSVVTVGSPCQLTSLYEIWALRTSVYFQGRVIAEVNAATAVLDPITVMDPVTPTRLVYVWDPLLNPILRFPTDDRTMLRGCTREAYHGPSFWYNAMGRTTFYTDAMGQETSPANPLAVKQEISAHNSGGTSFIATQDGLSQFKLRRSTCGQGLGLKN